MVPFAAGIVRAMCGSRDSEVYAITVDDDKMSYRPYLDKLPDGRVSFLRVPRSRMKKYLNKIYAYNILREARKICRDNDIDTIHLLTGDYTCGLIIPHLKKLCRVYYTVHDLVPHENADKSIKERLFNSYLRWGVKRNMKYADSLVTNSRSQYGRIKELFPRKGVYFHTFPSLVSEAILNGGDVCPEIKGVENYILFFGNIDMYKGVDYLYDAFRKNGNLAGHKLVIAGKGNIYFPHDKDPRVIFINRFVKDSEVKALYEKAACVVYPYISATQSGVLTLAYKLRTPVLASDVPFFRESANNECCIFFNRADADDLSAKLELILSSDTERMKRAQQEYYEEHYSQSAITASIEKVY